MYTQHNEPLPYKSLEYALLLGVPGVRLGHCKLFTLCLLLICETVVAGRLTRTTTLKYDLVENRVLSKRCFRNGKVPFPCPVTKTVNEKKPHYLHNTYRGYSLFNEEEKLRSRLEEELELKDVQSAIFLQVLKRVRKSPFIGC